MAIGQAISRPTADQADQRNSPAEQRVVGRWPGQWPDDGAVL